MTKDEWAEAVGWLALRYDGFEWTPSRIATYYEDLKRFDATDVWTAIYGHFATGSRYAPSSPELAKRAVEAQRAHRYDTPPQLPAGNELTWAEYSQLAYGEVIALSEAARREHVANGPCAWNECRTCHPKSQVTKQTADWV